MIRRFLVQSLSKKGERTAKVTAIQCRRYSVNEISTFDKNISRYSLVLHNSRILNKLFGNRIRRTMSSQDSEGSGSSNLSQRIDKFIDENEIALFIKSWCPYCVKAKALLDECQYSYKEWTLDTDALEKDIQATLTTKTGQRTVPYVFIRKRFIGGFSDLAKLKETDVLPGLLSSEEEMYEPDKVVSDFIASNNMVLFTRGSSPSCVEAEVLLRDSKVEYVTMELNNVDRGDLLEQYLAQLTGQETVPYIFINKNYIGSLDALTNLMKEGQLDKLLNAAKESELLQEQIKNYITTHEVVIYSKSWCPWCKRAKELLSTNNINFSAHELDLTDNGPETQEALHVLTGQKTVPNIFIHGQHIGGFSDLSSINKRGLLADIILNKVNVLNIEYDLIVIGGGSGGIAAAKEAASANKKVALCDFVSPSPRGTVWGLGGTCVNVGCIPKKLMHRAALIKQDIKDSVDFGWNISDLPSCSHSWGTMVHNIQKYISSLNDYYLSDLKENKVTYFNAKAKFIDKFTVRLTGSDGKPFDLKAKNFIIAVGGRPTTLELPNAPELCITSDDIFTLKHPPGKTLVIGASYIALECAGFLKGLGYSVTVMVRSILLRGFDQDCAGKIENYMNDYGVLFLKNCIPLSFDRVTNPDGSSSIRVKGQFGDGEMYEEEFDTVLVAIGRIAQTEVLNIAQIGIEVNPKNLKIIVNDNDQTSVKNIFAVGDVIEQPELTPVAIQAGKLLARRLFKSGSELMNYNSVPTTVFTPLEYGCVGFSEEDAIEKFGKDKVEVYHSTFIPLENALRSWSTDSMNQGFAKLVCLKEEKEEYVIGLHILSPNAGEITQGFAMGVQLKVTKKQFDALVGIHPTVAEVFTNMSVTKASGGESAGKGC